MTLPIALSIAGSDPSGGAGIQADLKTFHAHQVYGTAVITLLTAQSTRGVRRVETMAADLVAAQLDELTGDITPHAAKTGALGSEAIVRAVSERAARWTFPLIVDPVMVSKHGAKLIDDAAIDALRATLLRIAALITPNAAEAGLLAGRDVKTLADARDAARALIDRGARAVLVKGGHIEGSAQAIDILATPNDLLEFEAPRIATRNTHGTGCTYSAAITANIARGQELQSAIRDAKAWLTEALRSAPAIGHGIGPLNHFVDRGRA